ncbi:MAG: hypothetical protein ACHQII_05565, partial [Bacteroidia bacterium]
NNIIVIFILLLPLLFTSDANAKEKYTPHYDVVYEYIRSLGAIHNIQQTASKEFQESKKNDADTSDIARQNVMDGIRSSTRFKLELHRSIAALKGMTLKKPFETLIPTTISFYEHKIELFDEATKISINFLDIVPKPEVDYSKMTARMPEITASIEYIDEGIFESMVLLFGLLIDEKPDSEGHMSHLNITKEQRKKLIDYIDALFAESLDNKNKNWTVSSAALLKGYLLKDYKCIDEWQ